MYFLNFEFRLMVVNLVLNIPISEYLIFITHHFTGQLFFGNFPFLKKHIQSVSRLLEDCLVFSLIIFKDSLIFFKIL